MPDLRQNRKNIKVALGVLLAVDVFAVGVLFSPLIGSAASRRQELNQLWSELQTKTRQVEPLKNLDKKVIVANRQITDFYKRRFPSQDSQIVTEFGKLASANGITIESAKYKVRDAPASSSSPADKVRDAQMSGLSPVEMEAALSGNYISLAKFINALERDDMFFLISGITLGSEQKGPIKLQMKLETYLKAGA